MKRRLRVFLSSVVFLVSSTTQASDNPTTYRIGDTGPGGGIVFWVNEAGTGGLEVAKVDQGSAIWCRDYTDISGVDNIMTKAQPDGNSGSDNTTKMLTKCTAASAPGVAAAYQWPNGPKDGFLPNKEQLNFLINQRNVVDGLARGIYWSSSEISQFNAWFQDLESGVQIGGNKNSSHRVRAVRAF